MSDVWPETRVGCACDCDAPAVTVEYRSFTVARNDDGSADDVAFEVSLDSINWGEGQTKIINGDGTSSTISVEPATTAQRTTATGGRVTEVVRVGYRITYTGDGNSYTLRAQAVSWDGLYTYAFRETLDTAATGAVGAEVEVLVGELPVPDAPSDFLTSYTILTGSGGRLTITAGGGSGTATLTRRGFPPFREGAEVPVYYRQQTASGSFPGCAENGIPAAEYSGTWSFSEGGTGDPAGVETNEFSADVETKGGYQMPVDRLDEAPKAVGRVEDTATVRTVSRQVLCGGEALEETLTLTLSDPYTVEMLTEAVETLITLGLPNAGSDADGVVAARKLLTSGQCTYTYARADLAIDYGGFFAFATAPLDLVCEFRKRVLDRTTGGVTETTETIDFTTGPTNAGLPDGGPSGAWVESVDLGISVAVEAELGTEVVCDRFTTQEDWRVSVPVRLERVES